jgi:hypothetical protein
MATKNKNIKTTKRSAPKKTASNSKSNSKPEKEFPGYPKYGASEDITTQAKRIDENLDDEVLTQVKHHQEAKSAKPNSDQVTDNASLDDQESKRKNDFDVTEEDMEALGPKDLSMDGGEDEQLKHRTRPVDFTGEDLDVPGSELDDDQEEKGTEDEENNLYSLGGDEKNNLEEGQEHEGSL